MNYLLFALTLLPVFGVSIFSIVKPPKWDWLQDSSVLPRWTSINKHLSWRNVNILSLVFAVAVSCFAYFFIFESLIIEFRLTGSMFVSFLAFVLSQSFFTDGWYRLADRRVFYVFNIISLVVGSIVLFLLAPGTMLLMYYLLALLATILTFVPKIIGASDGRAMQLIVLAGFPILGPERFQWGLILFVPIILLYGIAMSIKNKSFKGFFTKLSVPMVPIMILPFLVSMLLPIL